MDLYGWNVDSVSLSALFEAIRIFLWIFYCRPRFSVCLLRIRRHILLSLLLSHLIWTRFSEGMLLFLYQFVEEVKTFQLRGCENPELLVVGPWSMITTDSGIVQVKNSCSFTLVQWFMPGLLQRNSSWTRRSVFHVLLAQLLRKMETIYF